MRCFCLFVDDNQCVTAVKLYSKMKARGTPQWDAEPELQPSDLAESRVSKHKRAAAPQTPVQPAAKPKQTLTPLGAPLAMDDIEEENAVEESEPFAEQQIEAEDLQGEHAG